MRVVAVSDTHLNHDFVVPDGDVFIHCGDATMDGRPEQLEIVGEWFAALPHRHKIVIAGNHERTFERFESFPKRYWPAITYLQDSGVVVEGLNIYGSPWQPEFNGWAFNLPRGESLARKWRLIPDDTDILITHGPPLGILDTVRGESRQLGCADLLARVLSVKPMAHLFGHIHSARGVKEQHGILFANASICDERYKARHAAIVLEVSRGRASIISQ
jgi:predicted phosphodiesterase